MTAAPSRRREILRAAERLFEHYGASKTTIADVAREAGVGVGTVYLEFACKEAIVEELSRAKHEVVLHAMRAAAGRGDLPFHARVAAVFDGRLEAYFRLARGGQHACDLVQHRSPMGVEARRRFLAEEHALVVDLVRLGVLARELVSDDPASTASALLACYATFAPPLVLAAREREARRGLAAVHAIVLEGIRTRRS